MRKKVVREGRFNRGHGVPVVVGAVRDDNRQAVGLVVGAHKVVAAGLLGAVGAVGAVGGIFGEEALGAEGSEYLVGRNVVEALALHGSGPRGAGGVE